MAIVSSNALSALKRRLAPALILATFTGSAFGAVLEDQPVAVLNGLDKITARISVADVPVGSTIPFGVLSITVRACRKAPPIEAPEAAAFLEISEVRPGEEPQLLFSGWMFASSPGISALNHPIYDVWLLDCKGRPAESSQKK